MRLLATACGLAGSALGAALCTVLSVVLGRRKHLRVEERVAFVLVVTSAVWYAAHAADRIATAAFAGPLPWIRAVDILAMSTVPFLVLHLALAVRGAFRHGAVVDLAGASCAALLLVSNSQAAYAALFSAALLAAAFTCFTIAVPAGPPLGVSLLVFLSSAAAGVNSNAVALGSLVPLLCVTWFIRQYNFLGAIVSGRLVFITLLSVLSTAYLFAVRRVSDYMEREYDAFGPLVEIFLIGAAAIAALPLYESITRFLSRRARLYAEFTRRGMDDAARLLDIEERAAFLARSIGETFDFPRVGIVVFGSPVRIAMHGAPGLERSDSEDLGTNVTAEMADMVHVRRSEGQPLCGVLERMRFNYAFPLRYEGQLRGVLLIDTTPRLYVEEDESLLIGLARQVSHSVEACRVVEEKITLEKTLLRQEHLAAVGGLAATIAHEVRNPLGPMKALAQLMAEDQTLDAKYHRDLEYMIAEMDRLNRCVEQLLTYSRPATVEGPRVAVGELISTICRSLRTEFASNTIGVETDIDPALENKTVNRPTVQQIILNLTLNAIQACGAQGKVRLQAATEGTGRLKLVVTDSGPGIPPAMQEKVFEPFFTTKHQGTGLGLAIVKKSVKELGGDVELVSPVAGAGGTSVIVTLPVT